MSLKPTPLSWESPWFFISWPVSLPSALIIINDDRQDILLLSMALFSLITLPSPRSLLLVTIQWQPLNESSNNFNKTDSFYICAFAVTTDERRLCWSFTFSMTWSTIFWLVLTQKVSVWCNTKCYPVISHLNLIHSTGSWWVSMTVNKAVQCVSFQFPPWSLPTEENYSFECNLSCQNLYAENWRHWRVHWRNMYPI